MNEAVNLYSQLTDSITLSEALAKYQECFDIAVGLFYSPVKCQFGEVRGNVVANEHGEVANLTGVFEARIFNKNAELRWLQHSAGHGKAVLIFESNEVTKAYEHQDPIKAIHSISHEYLLWGQGTGRFSSRDATRTAFNGWSYLSEARIGQLAVPISNIRQKDRVALQVQEYFDECDDHGNVAVVEERLISLLKSSITDDD